MRYLFDTHAFLWLASGDERLPASVRAIYEEPEHECFISIASVWEMAIKVSLGKLILGVTLARLVQDGMDRGIRLLSIHPSHAYVVETLPFHHRDPFDRMLVAQAADEAMLLVSGDEILDAYPIQRVWSRDG